MTRTKLRRAGGEDDMSIALLSDGIDDELGTVVGSDNAVDYLLPAYCLVEHAQNGRFAACPCQGSGLGRADLRFVFSGARRDRTCSRFDTY